jgi:hypothetical protein
MRVLSIIQSLNLTDNFSALVRTLTCHVLVTSLPTGRQALPEGEEKIP